MSTPINQMDFPALQEEKNGSKLMEQQAYLSLIADVTVDLELCVGTMALRVDELQNLKKGQVLPLDKGTDEPIELRLNGKTIACGELVVSENNYAIRLTEITGKS